MTQLEITRLPLNEKLQLMESLWDALCREPAADQPVPDWHEAVIKERLARLDAGEEELIPWEEAKQRLRAAANARR